MGGGCLGGGGRGGGGGGGGGGVHTPSSESTDGLPHGQSGGGRVLEASWGLERSGEAEGWEGWGLAESAQGRGEEFGGHGGGLESCWVCCLLGGVWGRVWKEGGFGWYGPLSICGQWGKTLGMGKWMFNKWLVLFRHDSGDQDILALVYFWIVCVCWGTKTIFY